MQKLRFHFNQVETAQYTAEIATTSARIPDHEEISEIKQKTSPRLAGGGCFRRKWKTGLTCVFALFKLN